MAFYVYILKSKKNGRYYIGSSSNVEKRTIEHNEGKTTSTKNKGPWVLVFKQSLENKSEALKLEKKLKQYKSRVIIERIVADQRIEVIER